VIRIPESTISFPRNQRSRWAGIRKPSLRLLSPSKTADQLRSGAPVRPLRGGTGRHLSLPYGCRPELRQLHPLVRWRRRSSRHARLGPRSISHAAPDDGSANPKVSHGDAEEAIGVRSDGHHAATAVGSRLAEERGDLSPSSARAHPDLPGILTSCRFLPMSCQKFS
jgi:hypothetical protein